MWLGATHITLMAQRQGAAVRFPRKLRRSYMPIYSEIETPCRESDVISPAETFDLGESRLVGYPFVAADNDRAIIGFGPPTISASSYLYRSAAYPERHGKNYNQLCCDGHVEAINPLVLFDPAQMAARYNVDNLPHPETWPP